MKVYQGMKLEVTKPFAHLHIGNVIVVKSIDDYGFTYSVERPKTNAARMSWKLFYENFINCCEIYEKKDNKKTAQRTTDDGDFFYYSEFVREPYGDELSEEIDESEDDCEECEMFEVYADEIEKIKEMSFVGCKIAITTPFDDTVIVVVRCPNGFVMTESYTFRDGEFCEPEGVYICLNRLMRKYEICKDYADAEIESVLKSIRS